MDRLVRLTFLLILLSFSVQAKNTWVYFDLGDTVIDTDAKAGFEYFSGTKNYINKLKKNGYKVGLISNIPESFGPDFSSKLKSLKRFISDKWGGQDTFDWGVFDKILLPLTNKELKPQPVLFARALVNSSNCPSLYISESLVEVEKSKSMGFAGHHFKATDKVRYIEVNKLDKYLVGNYKNNYSESCLN